MWLVLASITGLIDVAYNYYSRIYLKNNGDALSYSWWFSVFRSIFFTIICIFFPPPAPTQLSHWVILIALGLTNAINIYLYMKMHVLTEISLSQILLKLRLIWVPLIAFVLLEEKLFFDDYLGIFLILISALILYFAPHKSGFKPIITTVIFSFTTSLVTIFINQAIQFTTTTLIIICMSLPIVIIAPVLIGLSGNRLISDWNKNMFPKLFITILSVILLYLLSYSLKLGQVSKVNAVIQSTSIFSVIIGIGFLKEKSLQSRKIVACIISIIGVLLLV